MNDLVTLIMPVYNAENFLNETIESILNQTYKNWELIAVNDNSSDASLTVLKEYEKRDHRIQVYSFNENKKPATVRNFGISKAKGDFVGFIDADDICFYDRLEIQVEFLKRNSAIDLCGGFWIRFGKGIDYEKAYIKEYGEELKLAFIYENYIGNSTVLARKKVFLSNLFNSEFVPMEDYELWTRVIIEHNVYNIQKELVKYRLHDNNISDIIDVNYEKVKSDIQINYLKKIGFDINENDLKYLKKGLRIEQVESYRELKKIIFILNKFELNHKTMNFFDQEIVKNSITNNIRFYFEKLPSFRLSFLFFILKNHSNYFKLLSFKQKIKFVFKSFFW